VSALSAGLREIAESIGRKKGSFVLAKTDPTDKNATKPYALAVGSIRALSVNGGFTIMIGLSRDQVEKLRAMCDEVLIEDAS
jgi:hypothetical protein